MRIVPNYVVVQPFMPSNSPSNVTCPNQGNKHQIKSKYGLINEPRKYGNMKRSI